MATILFVTKNYPPAYCGVGDHTHHLCAELERLGHLCLVITEGKYSVTGLHPDHVFFIDSLTRGLYGKIKQVVKNRKVDTVFWQYVPYSYQRKGLAFWWPFVMLRVKFIGIKQMIFFHEVSIRIWGYGLRRFLAAFMQRCIANVASLFASSSFTSIPLFQSYFIFKRPFIIPISANIQAPEFTVDINSNQVFCFANRADRALFEAIKNISFNFPIKLVLGGALNSALEASLKQIIDQLEMEHFVSITGALPSAALAEKIAESAIFIQPQIVERGHEGGVSAKNGTMMAAMSMGKAIITCAGDMTDPAIFKDGENILFVPYSETEAYELSLNKLLKNRPYAQKLSLAAANVYNKQCSWLVTAKEIDNALQVEYC